METVIQEEIQKTKKTSESPVSEPDDDRGKDLFIEQLQKERNGFFNQLLTANHKMGELETKLLQLEGPEQKQI